MRNQRFGHCFLGNLLFFFSGIPPCCSGVCFNLLRGLFFSAHGIPPRNSAHLFYFASRIYFNSCTPPADRLLFLHIKCFLLSQASCCSCTSGAPRLPSCKGLRSKECLRRKTKWRSATTEQQKSAKRVMSNAQTKIAIRPHRLTTSSMKRFKILCLTGP